MAADGALPISVLTRIPVSFSFFKARLETESNMMTHNSFCLVVLFQERGGRGSRLVLCTDGLANVGLGALDDLKDDEEREAAEQFYDQLGIEVRALSTAVVVASVCKNVARAVFVSRCILYLFKNKHIPGVYQL